MSRHLGMSNVRDIRLQRQPLFGNPVYDRTKDSEAPELPLEVHTALSALVTLGQQSQATLYRDAAAVLSAWMRGQ